MSVAGLMANPHDASYDSALEEWELVAFDVVAGLLDKIGLKPTDVSIMLMFLTELPSYGTIALPAGS